MVGEDKKDMDFFSYIKNNKALIPVFFSGILTYEVFDHFFSEGMRPGAGAEGGRIVAAGGRIDRIGSPMPIT